MIKPFFVFAAVLFAFVFILATSKEEKPTIEVKASQFNFYIKERNQGDERATYYDKMTVRNIIKRGCFPIIPRDTNKNIEAVCSDSSKK